MGFLDSVKKYANPVNVINDVAGFDPQGVWDSFTGKSQQQAANEANINSAREQMAFQERMSSTAHQREVVDLQKAGINPMLSARLGGASTPSGALATVNPLPSATNKFVSTAMDVWRFADDRRVAQQGIRESESREDMNRASAIGTAAEVEAKKGGVPSRFLGLEMRGFLKKLFQRHFNSAKESLKSADEKELGDYLSGKSQLRYKRGFDLQRGDRRQNIFKAQ